MSTWKPEDIAGKVLAHHRKKGDRAWADRLRLPETKPQRIGVLELESCPPDKMVKTYEVAVAPLLAKAVVKYSKEIREADTLVFELTHQLRLLHQALSAAGKSESKLVQAAHERDHQRHKRERD